MKILLTVVLIFAAIPLLAVGKKKGWWFAVTGSIAILMINVPTQFIRTKTLDYLYGSLLALGVLVFMLIPYFKKRLLCGTEDDDKTEKESISG